MTEMYMHTFDTHKYIKELQSTGFNETQAEVIVKSLLESRDYDLSKLATRDQLTMLDSSMKHRFKAQEERFVQLEEKFESRFNTLEEKFDSRFKAQEEKFDAKLTSLEEKFEARFKSIEERFVQLEEKFEARFKAQEERFDTKLDALENRFDAKLDSLRDELKKEIANAQVSTTNNILKWMIPFFLTMMGMIVSLFVKLM